MGVLTELVEKLENADEATKLEIMKEYEFGTIFKNIFNGIEKIISETGIKDVFLIVLYSFMLNLLVGFLFYVINDMGLINHSYTFSMEPSIQYYFGGAILNYSEKYKNEKGE